MDEELTPMLWRHHRPFEDPYADITRTDSWDTSDQVAPEPPSWAVVVALGLGLLVLLAVLILTASG